MKWKKQITVVLLLVVLMALFIEITRSEFIIKLNRNENVPLIDFNEKSGKGIDKTLLNDIPADRYLMIYDDKEEFLKIKENFEKMLDYIKIGYDAVDVDSVRNINDEYDTVILILEDIDRFYDPDDLMAYVFEGGNLFIAFRLAPSGNFQAIYRKLGIYEFGDFVNCQGIRLLDNVLIKGEGLEITEEELMTNSSISLRLTGDCEKYAEAIDGTPLLWKRRYGLGNIMYFNGTVLADKRNRGFITGALGLLEEDFIYPVIDAKVSFIDDFPAPIPEGTYGKITEEYGMTISRFYKDVWWPDMAELAAKYNIKYTGVVIGTYNDETQKIVPGSTDLSIKDYIFYGRELIAHGGEIGIHGYNHQPFSTKELSDKELGYKPWKDTDTMIDAIEEINRLSKKAFPNYTFRVYVPPSNIIYPEGREAILAAKSDIRIICSLYALTEGKDTYDQEFEISPDGIVEFPRLTAGYSDSEENVWLALNGITSHGVFSHFVHPDDILDYQRTGNKGWSRLYREYDRFNKFIFDNYRWLRGMTASEGANEMIKYLICDPVYEKKDTYIRIYSDNLFDKSYFVLRSKKKIQNAENCRVKEIDRDVYLIESHDPVCQINFKR